MHYANAYNPKPDAVTVSSA